eukprot:4828689-Pyramimonas_sp.AAC.1
MPTKGASLSGELSSLMDADHPAQGERRSPDGSDEDTSDLTPQADKADIEHQSQAKHDRELTGRTPASQLKKQRDEDCDLNDSPLQEGFNRPAVASGDWRPPMLLLLRMKKWLNSQLRALSQLDRMKGMRSFGRYRRPQNARARVLDQTPR